MTETPTTPTIYNIPAENLPGLMLKLEKLSKKSQKLIGKDITFTILRDVRTPVTRIHPMTGRKIPVLDDDGNQIFLLSHDVTIDAEVPKINGWSFLATIDHSMESGNIVRVNPNAGIEVPEKYRTIGRHCDHCNKIRYRNDTLLLRCDATGEIKQIGRQCVRDFIGYDVESVVALAQLVNSATPGNDEDDDWGPSIKDRAYIPVASYLAYVAAIIRKFGLVSKQDALNGRGEATSWVALDHLFPPRNPPKGWKRVAVIEQDTKLATEALEWIRPQIANPANEYLYNVAVLGNENFIARRSIGYLSSLIPTYLKAMERDFKRLEARKALRLEDSQFVGAVKDKLVSIPAVLFGYATFPSRFREGTTTLYSFQTDDGNVLIWFASGDQEKIDLFARDAANRTPVTLSGTIKEHKERNGVKQTVLTRCKVITHRPITTEEAAA